MINNIMKVYELMEKVVRQKHPTNIKHHVVKYQPNIEDNNDKVGSGFEAKVYAGKDGGTVIKEVPIEGTTEDSATYQYINMVMSNQDNPFFPRVYNANLYTHKKFGRAKLVIHMEKLTEFNSEKVMHLLPQLLDQMGIDEQDVDAHHRENMKSMKAGSYSDNNASRQDTKGELSDVLWRRFRTETGRKELMDRATNPQLKQAIQLTHDILQKNAGQEGGMVIKADLHGENIMVRLTPHGPQLVITDPLVSFH